MKWISIFYRCKLIRFWISRPKYHRSRCLKLHHRKVAIDLFRFVYYTLISTSCALIRHRHNHWSQIINWLSIFYCDRLLPLLESMWFKFWSYWWSIDSIFVHCVFVYVHHWVAKIFILFCVVLLCKYKLILFSTETHFNFNSSITIFFLYLNFLLSRF